MRTDIVWENQPFLSVNAGFPSFEIAQMILVLTSKLITINRRERLGNRLGGYRVIVEIILLKKPQNLACNACLGQLRSSLD
jgi:hypothetical protein